MTCKHYWRDGILLVERGELDPHRDTCEDCRRAHLVRDALVCALPDVGATSTGDRDWQLRVWSRIAREERSRAVRSYWIGGGLAAACVAAVLCLLLIRPELASRSGEIASIASEARRPWLAIVPGPQAERSTSARVGDRARMSAPRGSEVRIYRADRLVLRCVPDRAAPGCVPDAQGLVAEVELTTAGEYHLIVISSVVAAPVGALDDDLAAVVAHGGDYKTFELSVR